MSDTTRPESEETRQGTDAAQTRTDAAQTQAPASPPVETPSAPGDEELTYRMRYDGAMRILNQRDKRIRELEDELNTTRTMADELQKKLEDLGAGAAAKEHSLGEQLSTATGELNTTKQQLEAATSELIKFSALKNHPDLLPLADTIPALPDKETMEEYLKLMSQGVTEIATAKAKQLTAGVTPGPTAPSQPKYNYSTLDEWQTALTEAAGADHFKEMGVAFQRWANSQ